jgi:hypothetical protein
MCSGVPLLARLQALSVNIRLARDKYASLLRALVNYSSKRLRITGAWKGPPGTNTLAYDEQPLATTAKRFVKLVPGANVIKLFLSVIYEFL